MKLSNLYRVLLLLYPADFRRQFSEEMISVFEQRASERFANRGSKHVAWLPIEFLSMVKGAYTMWLTKILPIRRNSSSSDVTESTLTMAELAVRRQTAIKAMCEAIGRHDFVNARQYSNEEARLKQLLAEMDRGIPMGQSRTA